MNNLAVFDWTINVGNIIQLVAFLGGGIYLWASMKGDVRIIRHDLLFLEKSMNSLSEAFKQLGIVLTQVAVQDNRLNMLEKVIDEMRHGQGFVEK